MSDLGSLEATIALFRGLAAAGETTKVDGRPRWVGRARSGKVSLEAEGDPVTRVSIALPPEKGAGTVVGAFVNQFAGHEARTWVAGQLASWSEDVSRPLDARWAARHRAVRIQSMLPLIVVTIEARRAP